MNLRVGVSLGSSVVLRDEPRGHAGSVAAPLRLVEGEEDVHAVERAGGVATTNPGGAGKWRPEYSELLRGAARVVVVPDWDEPGRNNARQVVDSLRTVGLSPEVAEPREGKDARDHLAAGHPLDALETVDLDGSASPEPEADSATGTGLLLPEEFWNAGPVLQHIRQAAHSRNRSGDVLLHALLARLASQQHHESYVDTGLGLASMNTFAVVCGDSGHGKSSGVKIAKQLLPVPEALNTRTLYRDGLPVGSGEGLAEMFMGTVEQPVDDPETAAEATGPRG